MIEYLEKLIHEKDYQKALEVAERMLGEGRREPKHLLVINSALFTSRYHLGQYLGAAEVGPTVIDLARALDEWDIHGFSCLDLSAAYGILERYTEAVEVLHEFLRRVPLYREARRFETDVWTNLGHAFIKMENFVEAKNAFACAIRVGTDVGNYRHAHAARHCLVSALLEIPELTPIPRLLARSAAYIRSNPEAYLIAQSRLYHLKLRAEFAIATRRYKRAKYVILQGLQDSSSVPMYQYEFHMLLAQVAIELGDVPEALGQALSAKVQAGMCNRHDLSARAADMAYKMLRMQPGALRELDERLAT